jgi:dipeptidyl aminopeptidase/acylaminoacyl peptidase
MFPRLLLALLLLLSPALAAGPRRVPTVDDLLALSGISGPQLSPDGAWVAYTVSSTDLKQDAYVTQIWLVQTQTGRAFQLTRGDKSCSSPQWSPKGDGLAFTSGRLGDKSQLFLIHPDGGEALPLTRTENGVGSYAWSRDGARIAFTTSEAPDPKVRRERLGDFEVVRREYAFQHLRTLELEEALRAPVTGTTRTQGKAFSVGAFAWSPDGTRIAFGATLNPDLIQGVTSDIYVLDLADNRVRKVVDQPGPDTNPQWSPDGRELVFQSAMGNPQYMHANQRLAIVAAEGGKPRSITHAFDEQPGLLAWRPEGILFNGMQKTTAHLFRVDPRTGAIVRLSQPDALMGGGFSLSQDGRQVAFVAPSPTTLAEVYVTALVPFAPRRLTRSSDQLADLILASREVISWKSRDGALIEGVLLKPADFDPSKKYPLLCVIHGGPTGVDRPAGVDSRNYPTDIWAGRGALVLKVNYRGSAGYGEKFRQLNVRNLGVGDAWDVLSGVDFLVAKGWVDPARVGCMGWSQGGYISAFLTTTSDRFRAISVGAGISNWATYYYNTDITPFTPQYLGADPATDPAIYAKTSPMTTIQKAKTPTLIQHGELDRRVPIANAFELRQGLEDRGVPVEMVVYKGFGHGITKPRSQRAVMLHNLAWFNHYIFGDPLPDLAQPELPKATETAK